MALAQGQAPEDEILLTVPPSTRTRVGWDAPDAVRRQILAAAAAAWALGLPSELIHAGLLHMRKSATLPGF